MTAKIVDINLSLWYNIYLKDINMKTKGGFKLQSIFKGDKFTNNIGLCYEVIEYFSATKRTGGVKIKFDISGYEGIYSATEVRAGEVKDHCSPTVCGVGYFGVGEFICSLNGIKTREYLLWHNMLKRCYEDNHPTYDEKYVIEDWHNFQNFAKWCHSEEGFNLKSNGKYYNLDKDLLYPNNKVYSPDTCCFIPHSLNTALVGKSLRTGLLCGVYKNRNGEFVTHVDVENGKVKAVKHKDVYSANMTYKLEKLRKIKECAELHKEYLSDKVLEAIEFLNLDERIIYN